MDFELARVSFSYGARPILHDATLTLPEGAGPTFVLGRNGVGKSTLLKLLSGFLRPTAGAVQLGGRDPRRMSGRERAAAIAVVPQASGPALDCTAFECVLTGRNAFLSPWSPASTRDLRAVHEAMERMDVFRFADVPCSRLSGGELQRVFIAAALAQESRWLLMDEPTSSLDPAHIAALMRVLSELDRTVVIVTHDASLARAKAARVLLLHEGVLFADGTPDAVMTEANLHFVYGCPVRVHADAVAFRYD